MLPFCDCLVDRYVIVLFRIEAVYSIFGIFDDSFLPSVAAIVAATEINPISHPSDQES